MAPECATRSNAFLGRRSAPDEIATPAPRDSSIQELTKRQSGSAEP